MIARKKVWSNLYRFASYPYTPGSLRLGIGITQNGNARNPL
jgi:hypothetical protein